MRIDRYTLSAAVLATSLLTQSATAGEMKGGYYLTSTDGAFADVVADLHDGIINQGLVIDYTGRVGDMLARTADVVEQDTPYADAEYVHFCSAERTHAAVAANPENLAMCPYVVFAYSLKAEPDTVYVGYRRPMGAPGDDSEAAVADIDALLRGIVDTAAGE